MQNLIISEHTLNIVVNIITIDNDTVKDGAYKIQRKREKPIGIMRPIILATFLTYIFVAYRMLCVLCTACLYMSTGVDICRECLTVKSLSKANTKLSLDLSLMDIVDIVE